MRQGTAALLAALLTALAGCDSGEGREGATGHEDELPRGGEQVLLDPADLTSDVDHRFFPLVPRTQWRYRETGDEGTFDVVVTVTDRTRRLADGVEARVVRDTVSRRGEVVEDTFDFYAQDGDGTVWYLGEQTVELEGGQITTREGSFEAGKDGAQAGVIMPARPRPGQAYRQEHLAGEAEDDGAVLATSRMVEVPAGHYDGALLTEDTSRLEPRVAEYKLYAPGVGLVLTIGVSGGASREELLDVRRVPTAVAHAAGMTPLGRLP